MIKEKERIKERWELNKYLTNEMSDKEKEEKDIAEQLGPITEFHMKMRLPQAFVDYVEEVAVKQNREAASLEE